MKSFISDKNRKLSKACLYQLEDLSFSAFMKALRKKDVKVNGVRVNKDITINIGDKVEVFYTAVDTQKYTTIYTDQNVLVIDKKQGYSSEDVYQDLLKENQGLGFIHRLDRNTSGIMIFSKNQKAEEELLSGFKNRTFDKKYRALVFGKTPKNEDVISAYLSKDSVSATVKITNKKIPGSVPIKTGYKLIEYKDGKSLLEVTLFTGKTHQIRAHLAHIGNPIVGDGKYGNNQSNILEKEKWQKLQAVSLTLHFSSNQLLYYLNDKTFNSNQTL